MQNYVIYPEGEKILQHAKIDDRLKELSKKDDIFYNPGGFVSASDVVGRINSMTEEGFFTAFPPEESTFKKDLQKLFNHPDSFSYNINNQQADPLDYETISLLSGWDASYLFSPEELWDYRRFGASSLTSFVGLIGAYMKNTSETKEGKHFNTSQAEKLFDNVIAGSMHYDLRIYQTDVTPYSCLDPFGNQVSYRPLRAMDKSRVLGYHSTELDLLVSILRYVYHQKIDSLLFKNRAEALFSYTKDLSQKGDGTTEHLTGSDSNITLSFSLFDTPFPLLDGRNKIKRAGLLGDSISTFSAQSSSYVICTNEKNDFLIGVEKEGLFQPVVSYSSKDIDAFTLSLIEQSARGLGRTSLSELVDALHFRYSNEFTKLMREVKKF